MASVGGVGRVLNVTDGAAVDALIDEISKTIGPVSVLVNNAGITRDQILMRMKDDDWNAIIDTNLSSVYRTSKAVMRGMMKARKGRIINIASVIGLTGNAGQVQLRRRQGRHHRVLEIAGQGNRLARHYRQCGRAGFHPDRHDRLPAGRRQKRVDAADCARPAWRAVGYRRSGGLSGQLRPPPTSPVKP